MDTARGRELADEFGAVFFETSAKDGTGVKDAFHALARLAVGRLPEGGGAAGGGSGGKAAGDASSVTQLKGGAPAGGGKAGKDCAVM